MKNSKKTVAFILESYPIDSQAFITNQIIGVLKAGYQVKIAVNKLNPLKGSTQEETRFFGDILGRRLRRRKDGSPPRKSPPPTGALPAILF